MQPVNQSMPRTNAVMESLERRALFSASAFIPEGTGVLEITGTDAGDVIAVNVLNPEQILVTIDGSDFGTFLLSDLPNGINITAGEGDDAVFFLNEPFLLNTRIDGGLGDDALGGGAGRDEIFGGAGDDDLAGFAGDDVLNGGDDSDLLDGGEGADTLTGGLGIDEVYGGVGTDVFIGDTLDEIGDLEAGEPDGQDTGGGGEEPTDPEKPCKHGKNHPGRGNHYGHLKCRA